MSDKRTPTYLHRHEPTGTVIASAWFDFGTGWTNLGRCFE